MLIVIVAIAILAVRSKRSQASKKAARRKNPSPLPTTQTKFLSLQKPKGKSLDKDQKPGKASIIKTSASQDAYIDVAVDTVQELAWDPALGGTNTQQSGHLKLVIKGTHA